MTRLLKPEEAAERLAVSPKAVRLWLREGKLPGIRLGRLWRIAEDKLEEFIAGQGFEQEAAARPPQVAQDERTPPRETRSTKAGATAAPRKKGPQTPAEWEKWGEEHLERMRRRRARKGTSK